MILPLLLALAAAAPPDLTVERAVVLMRHGVRPPTKAVAMPEGVASGAWPAWPVAPGYLTPHGARAIALVGAADRTMWRASGLLPAQGCPKLRIAADSDQRTIATAEAYAAALAPGCTIAIDHKPQDVADPIFSAIEMKAVPYDAGAARNAVVAGIGPAGLAAEDSRMRPQLARLDAILCGGATTACGVSREPTALAPLKPGARPKLSGAIDRASTGSQILLLEYAEGKPMAEVGWGRATAADIATLSAFHALEFQLLARPPYVAKANLGLISPMILDGLLAKDAATITMISGHDTNVANLGGLLDVHWQVPGLARDDPSPGGAIVLEALRDAAGARYVRALYRSQTLDQIRTLADPEKARPYVAVLPIPGCAARGVTGLCTEAQFWDKMGGR